MRRTEKARERGSFRERGVNSVRDEKNRRKQKVPRQNHRCFSFSFWICLMYFVFLIIFLFWRENGKLENSMESCGCRWRRPSARGGRLSWLPPLGARKFSHHWINTPLNTTSSTRSENIQLMYSRFYGSHVTFFISQLTSFSKSFQIIIHFR